MTNGWIEDEGSGGMGGEEMEPVGGTPRRKRSGRAKKKSARAAKKRRKAGAKKRAAKRKR